MKTIKIYNLGEAWEQPAVAALLSSPGIVQTDNQGEADAFVCWGLRPPYESRVAELNAQGRPVIVLDSGYLNRPRYGRPAQEDDYYAVNLGGILRPKATSDVLNSILTIKESIRRDIRMLKYLQIPDSNGADKRSIILGQTVGDRSHGLDEEEMVRAYTEMAGGNVLFRPHPQDGVIGMRMAGVPGVSVLSSGLSLEDELVALGGPDNVVVMTLCSNAGLEAKLAGYTVKAKSAWYRDMERLTAFTTACDGQFNCPELNELGYRLVDGLINLKS